VRPTNEMGKNSQIWEASEDKPSSSHIRPSHLKG
jgi:hypothetical protein